MSSGRYRSNKLTLYTDKIYHLKNIFLNEKMNKNYPGTISSRTIGPNSRYFFKPVACKRSNEYSPVKIVNIYHYSTENCAIGCCLVSLSWR